MAYLIEHNGKVYSPDGVVTLPDGMTVDDINKQNEKRELEWLAAHPERVFLYMESFKDSGIGTRWGVTTQHGSTLLDSNAIVGPPYKCRAFGSFPSVRRSVRCTIFGRWYYGTYYESSGDYCRLKRAKRQ